MGYYKNHKGINCYEPDNNTNTLYIRSEAGNLDLEALIERCKEHFPNKNFSDINISCTTIQTDCIGYDRYDSGYYTNFIIARI